MPNFTDFVVPKQKNIADLPSVDVSEEIITEDRKDADDKTYTVSFIMREEVEYRVPNSIVTQIQDLIEGGTEVKIFNVSKTGEGLKTKYTLQILE